jgi:hypothetical protein
MNSFGNFKFLGGKMVHIPKWEFQDVTSALPTSAHCSDHHCHPLSFPPVAVQAGGKLRLDVLYGYSWRWAQADRHITGESTIPPPLLPPHGLAVDHCPLSIASQANKAMSSARLHCHSPTWSPPPVTNRPCHHRTSFFVWVHHHRKPSSVSRLPVRLLKSFPLRSSMDTDPTLSGNSPAADRNWPVSYRCADGDWIPYSGSWVERPWEMGLLAGLVLAAPVVWAQWHNAIYSFSFWFIQFKF